MPITDEGSCPGRCAIFNPRVRDSERRFAADETRQNQPGTVAGVTAPERTDRGRALRESTSDVHGSPNSPPDLERKAPERPEGFGARTLAFIGRHKPSVAAALIGAGLIAQIAGVSPVQVTTHPDPRTLAVDVRPFPGQSFTLFSTPCRTETGASTLVAPTSIAAEPIASGESAYRDAVRRYIAEEEASIAALGLSQKPNNRSFALTHEGHAPKGVAIMFHGFNVGPKQLELLAHRVHALGYDVFAPSLPGHGLVDGEGRDVTKHIPNASNRHEWQRFQDRVLDVARASGQVTVIGHSAGAMLGLNLAERHAGVRNAEGTPLIRQVIAVSPLLEVQGDYKLNGVGLRLGPIGVRNQSVAELLNTAQCAVGLPVDRYLNGQAVTVGGPKLGIDYGSRQVDQDIVLGLVITANQTTANAERLRLIPGGVRMILTASDDTIDPRADIRFAERIGADYFVFPAEERVPHSMISPFENGDRASLERSHALILERLR